MSYTVNDFDQYHLFRYASLGGTFDGDTSVNKDYTVTEEGTQDYYIEAQPGEILLVYRMMIYIVDTGSFDSGGYGNGAALDNGIILFYRSKWGTFNVSRNYPIKTNIDWARYCYDVAVSTFGQGDEALSARWTFSKSGSPITLREGDALGVRVSDDLSHLVDQTFLFQGMDTGAPDPRYDPVLP